MTKKDKALSLLELIPNPNSEDVIKIATKVGCSERTVYRALEVLRLTQDCQSDTNKKQVPKSSNKLSIKTTGGQHSTLPPNNIINLSWKEKLELAIVGQLPLNTTALTLYDKLGYLKEDEQEEVGRKFVFREPEWFVPHQSDMYNAMIKGNCCIIGMRQFTFKTTTGLIAAGNLLHTRDKSLIVQISTGMDLSKELLNKIRHDERVMPVWEPILKTDNAESKILNNGSRLICRPCKPSSLQGLTGGLWIDELDKIIGEKQTRQALAAALPIVITLLMNGTGFIWITGNQASDEGALQFEYFINVLSKFGNYFPIYRITDIKGIFHLVQINNFDIEIPTQDEPILRKEFFKDMMFQLLAALYDLAFAKAQILNLYDDASGMFKADLVAYAFEEWSKDLIPELAYNCVMAVDPGHTHATGVIILQKDKHGNLIEVFAKEYFGKQISEDDFKEEIFQLYREWGVREMFVESNSGGKWWRDHWVMRGLNCSLSNFGTTNPQTGETSNMNRAFERAWYERVLKDFLEKKKIFLHNENLFREFSLYNPVENKEKGKGDLVDALLHCCFHAAGGIAYLMELLQDKEGLVSGDDSGAILI